jgi:hypothetical protein
MDVDDEADLQTLAQWDLRGTETGEWLHRSGFLDRLRQAHLAAATSGNGMKFTATT